MCFIPVFMAQDGAFMGWPAPFGCLPLARLKFRSECEPACGDSGRRHTESAGCHTDSACVCECVCVLVSVCLCACVCWIGLGLPREASCMCGHLDFNWQ